MNDHEHSNTKDDSRPDQQWDKNLMSHKVLAAFSDNSAIFCRSIHRQHAASQHLQRPQDMDIWWLKKTVKLTLPKDIYTWTFFSQPCDILAVWWEIHLGSEGWEQAASPAKQCADFYHSTLHVSFPELPDKTTLSEDCGMLVGCSCLSQPVANVGLERFTVGNLVPAIGTVSIRHLIAAGAGKLRSTFCTSNLLHKRLQCTISIITEDKHLHSAIHVQATQPTTLNKCL
jgi:hypothetical protein